MPDLQQTGQSRWPHLLHAHPLGGLGVGAIHIVPSSCNDVDPSVLGQLPEGGQVPADACGGVLHYGAPTSLSVGQQLVPHSSGLLLQKQVLEGAVGVLSKPVHMLHVERVLCHRLVAWRGWEVAAVKGHSQVLVGHGAAKLLWIHQAQDCLDLATQL